jgi:hypothetical protein
MVAFNNSYTAAALNSPHTQQYLNAIAAAEQLISANWTTPITLNITFDLQAKGTGPNIDLATNSWPAFVNVSYATLRNTLIAHANNPDAQVAVASLPATDPTVSYAGTHVWSLPEAYARMLGLSQQVYTPDDTVVLNSSYNWSYGQDVINSLVHEITEGAMGRVGGLGDQNSAWSTLDLFRYSSPGVRDFTDGRDGKTTYFSLDGKTLLYPFNNQYNFGTHENTGDTGDFNVLDPFGFGEPGNNGYGLSGADFNTMNLLGWTPAALPGGLVAITASGDFNSNSHPDFVWRDSNAVMSMWEYDAQSQTVSTTGLGTVSFSWVMLGDGHFVDGSVSQMLMDYAPNGTMTLWWVSNGALTGINLGQRWTNIDYIAAGQFTSNGGTNFLVNNTSDNHLYDWWVAADGTLQGIDLGAYWSTVGLVATGRFTANGGTNFLVNNTLDNHLYDWWIDGNNTLQGIDLGPYWANVAFLAMGDFVATGGTNLLVDNTVDHHLYDWWIGNDNALHGVDLGAHWSNVQLVATGRFDDNTSIGEILVQNTLDHHLYEWWITGQGQLTGIDLGPYWANVQLIGHAHYNDNSTREQLLVRNTSDGHFYQWWIENNQLNGVDLGVIAGSSAGAALRAGAVFSAGGGVTLAGASMMSPGIGASSPSASAASTSLLVQSMASFGSTDAVANSIGTPLGAEPSPLAQIAAPTNQHLAHS